jgi:hypothetical protein
MDQTMGYTPAFLRSPSGCTFNIFRIGGVKAVETGLVILGTSPDELLDYVESPPAVAVAWRDAAVHVLETHRAHRPLQQVDWIGIAVEVDPTWAKTNGWTDVGVADVASTQTSPAAAQPARRRAANETET